MIGYLVGKAAKILNVHPNTLRRYEEKGLITSNRDMNGWRRYNADDLLELKEKLNSPSAVWSGKAK